MRRREGGYTLIEMMISLFTGLIVIATALTIFRYSVQSARFHSAAAVMDESAQVGLQILADEIMQAGYSGIALSSGEIDYMALQERYDCAELVWGTGRLVVRGYGADFVAPSSDCLNTAHHVEGSDILVVWKTDSEVTDIRAEISRGEDEGEYRVTNGRLFLVSDINQAYLMVTADGNRAMTLGKRVNSFYPSVYFLRPCISLNEVNRSNCDEDEDIIPTLTRKVERGTVMQTDSLVPGVADMRLQFVVEDANEFYLAGVDQVNDWQKVVAVKVHLLLRSEQHVYREDRQTEIQFAGQEVSKTDRFLWRSYSKMTALRNLP